MFSTRLYSSCHRSSSHQVHCVFAYGQLEVKKKAPSRARYEPREEMSKMAPPPLERYAPYPTPGHHDPTSFNSNPMAGFFKTAMSAPTWKAWNPAMLQPMGAAMGPGRPGYMGMGMHDDRGARAMGYDATGGMGGAYPGGAYRANPAYAPDWRAGPPGMRAGAPGPYPSAYHQHPAPPPSVGPARNQRGSRGYAPY